jgi:DNA-binding GntR family transcriptional regulator
MIITERLPKESARDYALRILKHNIIHLELAPGIVVSENELSSQLELSRTPVREALIELSKSGIVEILPQRAAVSLSSIIP